MTLAFGAVVAVAGVGTWQRGIKRHFLDAYLQVAALVILSTLTWSALDADAFSPWLLAPVAAAGLCIVGGVRSRRVSVVVYGAFAGYISVSRELIRHSLGIEASFLYVVLSAGLMIVGLVMLSRQLGRQT